MPSQTVADFIMNESIDRLRCHFGLTLAEAGLGSNRSIQAAGVFSQWT